jgi:serine protease Do
VTTPDETPLGPESAHGDVLVTDSHSEATPVLPSPARLRAGAITARRVVSFATACALFLDPLAALAKTAPESFADLAAKLLPSVVNISTSQTAKGRESAEGEQQPSPRGPQSPQQPQQRPQFPPGSPFEDFFREFFDRQQRRDAPARRSTSLGSGFIIDASGLVVTNNHVVAEADEIVVTLADDTKLDAKIVGRDAKTDLALLRVQPKSPLPALAFGDSSASRVGDWVIAIGNPFGLGGTVTAGIVSARHRDINSGPYDDFIQTDASINRGNSGGPMFNLAGEVIGVNTAIYSPSGGSIGIGFAIPSNLAKPIIEQLRQFGRAKRGWLGVRIQTVTDEIAQGLKLDKPTGALVAGITEKGPAEASGIQVGDVILKFDGKEVNEMRRLPRVVAETAVGNKVQVEVWRKGKKIMLPVVLGEFPEDEAQVAATEKTEQPAKPDIRTAVSALGLKLAPVNNETRDRYKLGASASGVVVTEVEDGSPAAEKDIRPGDLIRKIGPEQSAVTKPSQVVEHVDKAREAKVKTILVLVERDGNQRFIAIKVEKG